MSKSAFKILVAEIRQTFHGFITMPQPDIRQGHSIKGIVFAGCIYGHIAKHEKLSVFQRLLEAVISYNIPGKAIAQIALSICFGAGAIWGLIKGIMILTGKINKDANGVPLKE